MDRGVREVSQLESANFAATRRHPRTKPLRSRRVADRFSQEQVIHAIRVWTAQFGAPPTTTDWEPARARRLGQEWRAERFESGDWPSARIVCARFESFNGAVAQAGFTPNRAPFRQRSNLSGPEAILEAFIAWTRRYGDIPTMADWDPARARRLGQDWRIARYLQGDWPSGRSVATHFGSFTNAAIGARLIPRGPGTGRADRRAERAENRHAAARASASGRDPGVEDLTRNLTALAAARRTEDPVAMHAALIDLAGSALHWAEAIGA
jgi:hypothetical protein